jgi:hypothetical protein
VDWEGRGDACVPEFAGGGEGMRDSNRLENAGTRFQLGPSNGQGAVAGGSVGCIEGIERRFRW